MRIRAFLLALVLLFSTGISQAADDYKQSPTFLALRDSVYRSFNEGDSIRFFPAITKLEQYLFQQGDLHAYYTQRCNEIIFELNRKRVFEAYRLGRQLSVELQEKGLHSEMYMAYNMLGHIDNYCGNKAAAKRIFYKVIDMMEEAGYYESIPPIYMNIVSVVMEEDPEEALRLIDTAKEIAEKYSPERVFDIEARKAVCYFNQGDKEKFFEAYKHYQEGLAEGKTSVHGRSLEVYYLAMSGKTDEAVALAKEELGDEAADGITMIYERAGRWQEAYEALRQEANSNDSVTNVVLINSMRSIRDETRIHEARSRADRIFTISLAVASTLLALLALALGYIVFTRHRHMKELKKAYEHALESDKMKSEFIRNVTHEVRTPLNIISGFAQVIADPELVAGQEERLHISQMMQKNTQLITSLIDEMLELSLNESNQTAVAREDIVEVNDLLCDLLQENEHKINKDVKLLCESTLGEKFVLKTNEDMLRRAISLLLDNAIKYTNTGSIILKAEANDQELTIAVEDTGVGIPVEEAEHIFERFFKLDTFREGLGLGLPLCRIIINKLGGTVNLDTSYQDGARFVVKVNR